jgi:hypothetical protein
MKSSKEAWNYLSSYLIRHVAVRCGGELVLAFSTWLPSFESGTVDGRSVFGASGTQRICSVQGFFIQVGMAAPLYSGVLTVYYLLMVRYGWNENSNKKVST